MYPEDLESVTMTKRAAVKALFAHGIVDVYDYADRIEAACEYTKPEYGDFAGLDWKTFRPDEHGEFNAQEIADWLGY